MPGIHRKNHNFKTRNKMETETLMKGLEALGLFCLVIIFVINKIRDTKDITLKTILDLAISTVEEAVAYSEDRNRLKKREAAVNTAKALKKNAVEISKDPIQTEKFMQEGLRPIREIAHSDARNYIINAVESIKDTTLRKGVAAILNNKTIDQCIKMRIAGPKMGVGDPLKSFLYREM